MTGYKISSIVGWGEEVGMQITVSYTKAIQKWNDSVRKMIAERNCVYAEDFGEIIQDWKEDNSIGGFFKEDNDRYEFLYSVAPIIVYKDRKTNSQIAAVYFMYNSSYEFNEWDITSEFVVLEEIEIIE